MSDPTVWAIVAVGAAILVSLIPLGRWIGRRRDAREAVGEPETGVKSATFTGEGARPGPRTRYFVATTGPRFRGREVTKAEYVATERGQGFYNSLGFAEDPATSRFVGLSMQGWTEYDTGLAEPAAETPMPPTAAIVAVRCSDVGALNRHRISGNAPSIPVFGVDPVVDSYVPYNTIRVVYSDESWVDVPVPAPTRPARYRGEEQLDEYPQWRRDLDRRQP